MMMLITVVVASFLAASASENAYADRLLRSAVPTHGVRVLDNDYEQVDISRYSVRFEKCHFVKTYDDHLAAESADTVLGTTRFVTFRLCPDFQDDCSFCNYIYGEYLIDLREYLKATVGYLQDVQYQMCRKCEKFCVNEEEGFEEQQTDLNIDCDTCKYICYQIENMEENGYIDATEFVECQLIYDPVNENEEWLYAGPICASGGSKIKIGVFKDEDCKLSVDKDVDDYLYDGDGGSFRLSHFLLKQTYTNNCISCMEPQDDPQYGDAQDEDQVLDMCEWLYDGAGKCEKAHGFEDGYANYNGYENQLAQEDLVCDFMRSLSLTRGTSYSSQEQENEIYPRQEPEWLAGYALKFQGCDHFPVWNFEADYYDDVRLSTKRLAHYSLCPTNSCSEDNGCSKDCGDYTVDLNVYTKTYFESKRNNQAFECDDLDQTVCSSCLGTTDEASCLYDCYDMHNMANVCTSTEDVMIQQRSSSLDTFNMDCSELPNSSGNRLYIGPYCGAQGTAVFLGLFTDDSCTIFADNGGGGDTYQALTNHSLIYAKHSIIEKGCLDCDSNDGICDTLYPVSGKCELMLPNGTMASNNACTFIEDSKPVLTTPDSPRGPH